MIRGGGTGGVVKTIVGVVDYKVYMVVTMYGDCDMWHVTIACHMSHVTLYTKAM